MKIPAVGGNVDINDNLIDISKNIWNCYFEKDLKNNNLDKTTLLEYADIISGGTPSKKMKDYYDKGEIAWITPKDLSKNKNIFVSSGSLNITCKGLKNSSAKLMPKGSVLFSSRAPIGYIAISKNKISTNQGFKSLVPLDKDYVVFLYFLMNFLKQTIINEAGGSTFKEISGSGIKSIYFSKMKKEKIKSFNMDVISVFNEINELESENNVLINIKSKLLNKLL